MENGCPDLGPPTWQLSIPPLSDTAHRLLYLMRLGYPKLPLQTSAGMSLTWASCRTSAVWKFSVSRSQGEGGVSTSLPLRNFPQRMPLGSWEGPTGNRTKLPSILSAHGSVSIRSITTSLASADWRGQLAPLGFFSGLCLLHCLTPEGPFPGDAEDGAEEGWGSPTDLQPIIKLLWPLHCTTTLAQRSPVS